MNKEKFTKELQERTGYTLDQCKQINDILEDTSLIGKKNKEKMISEFTRVLNINEEKANTLYETIMDIIGAEIKNKLKHPFKDMDKEA